MSDKFRMQSLPVEVIANVFAALPSFTDVLNLAATCKQQEGVLAYNLNTIYSAVAPNAIICHHEAREYLAKSGGPPVESPLSSIEDIRIILNKSRKVEQAVEHFERQLYPITPDTETPATQTLTPKEMRRYTKAYYTVLHLLNNSPETWRGILQPVTIKFLWILVEITGLPQAVHRRTYNPNVICYFLGHKTLRVWLNLYDAVRTTLEEKYARVWRIDLSEVAVISTRGPVPWIEVLRTDWEDEFKNICCDPCGKQGSRNPPVNMDEVWEESDDEGL